MPNKKSLASDAANAAMAEFLAETDEILERLTLDLGAVERQAHSSETLNSVYRDMHTLKGTAQLFGCMQMGQLAHAMETCLEPVRAGTAVLGAELVDALYVGIDAVRRLALGIRESGVEPDVKTDLDRLLPRLLEMAASLVSGVKLPVKDLVGITDDGTSHRVPEPKAATRASGRTPVSTPTEIKPQAVVQQKAEAPDESIRVQVGLLDSLMNLVGELVLIRNQVIQHSNTRTEDSEFVNLSQRLNIVSTELQNEVMKTRMQPIGNILSKFQRIVRDMSRELGKEIELKLEGTETELDKTLIEAVKDPLTHIVRNSVDHGIEMPDVRREAGKGAQGQITIRSYHEGGQVIVEVSDDGRGLRRAKIGAKAVENGLITSEALDRMTDREVNNLIFLPGFSTAEKVSNISGRGVGMDVVRTNIEKIGGMVDLNSTEGQGMVIRLKIPLTLAIVPALIVTSGSERFAIPQVKLVELVRIDSQDDSSVNEIELLQGQPVLRLRGNLLPLVSLTGLLGLNILKTTGASNIAVLSAENGQFGLIVDTIEDSTDIVVKPLSAFLKNLGVYSGATVLGDGSVALVLDVVGLAERAHIFGESTRDAQAADRKDEQEKGASDLAEYLVIDVGTKDRYTIPLCLVNRLEEFKRSTIERAGAQNVVRYRGAILPLISIPNQLALETDTRSVTPEDSVPVVVIEHQGRHFGLEVKGILDIIAMDATVDPTIADRPAILGTCCHTDGIVNVIDVFRIIETAFPDTRRAKSGTVGSTGRTDRSRFHVLLVDDNGFFRKHVQQLLSSAGFTVSTEINGEEALKRLTRAETGEFSLVLSDIEMPKMDGYQLAEKVRTHGRYAKLPLVALTTRNRPADQEKGLKAGFDRYLAKLDADELIHELDLALGLVREKQHGT